jgi:hypothetical protein
MTQQITIQLEVNTPAPFSPKFLPNIPDTIALNKGKKTINIYIFYIVIMEEEIPKFFIRPIVALCETNIIKLGVNIRNKIKNSDNPITKNLKKDSILSFVRTYCQIKDDDPT